MPSKGVDDEGVPSGFHASGNEDSSFGCSVGSCISMISTSESCFLGLGPADIFMFSSEVYVQTHHLHFSIFLH